MSDANLNGISPLARNALALLLCAGAATAALAGSAALPSFESLDRNTDQRLSRSEASYNRMFADIFASSDADGDGFVSRTEYAGTVEKLSATANLAKR